jgi:prepilin-type N-terminal cleavage/methylation domain-containing protein
MNYKTVNKAFSLIELSVVILVIGILVIGITQGSRIMSQAKISAAQSLTTNSSIASINGLSMWLEATDEANIVPGAVSATVYGNVADGASVSKWRDRNPHSAAKIVMSTSVANNRPTYVRKGINNLPSLSFNGSTNFMSANAAPIGAGDDDYTIIVVWRPLTLPANSLILEQRPSSGSSDQRYAIMHVYSSSLFFASYAGDTSTLATVSANTNYINIMTINNSKASNNVAGYSNSNTGVLRTTSASPSLLNVAADIFVIGGRSSGNNNINALVSEMIIYNRALKQSEIVAINEYLSKKYSIRLS